MKLHPDCVYRGSIQPCQKFPLVNKTLYERMQGSRVRILYASSLANMSEF